MKLFAEATFALVLLYVFKCNCNQTGRGGRPLFNKPSLLLNRGSASKGKIRDSSSFHFHSKHQDGCVNTRSYTEKTGVISSPTYPLPYKNHTSCTWAILIDPGNLLIISFDDLDIEESPQKACLKPLEASPDRNNPDVQSTEPCCSSNWVKISRGDGEHEVRYCGRSEDRKAVLIPFVETSERVVIKFHVSMKTHGGRGFHLTYSITPLRPLTCEHDELRCANGRCILNKWRCNRRDECGDNSDEVNCDNMCAMPNEARCSDDHEAPGCYSFPNQKCNGVWDCINGNDEKGCSGCPEDMYRCSSGSTCYSEAKRCDGVVDCPDFDDELDCGLCGPNKTQCSPLSVAECFDPFTQRCNRHLDCKNGNDEKGCTYACRSKILCASGSGCYSPDERCNGLPNCKDGSDERNCSVELCRPEQGNFLCNNGRCIRKAWTCDRNDHCGDSSDESGEANCLKNSVITAALMGSLICGLLLVIAISCTCKLIALRQVEQRQENDSHSRPSNVCPAHPHVRCYPPRESQLFGLDHDYFYREPPPSYSAAVEQYDSGDFSQQRRRRRERRHRRRPLILSVHAESEPPETSGPPSFEVGVSSTSSCTVQEPSTSEVVNKSNEGEGSKPCEVVNESSTSQEASSLASINIELDNIASCDAMTCDQQPLLS